MSFLRKLFSKRTEPLPDIPPEFLQENAPDWLIELNGNDRANADAFSIRVQLFQSSRSAKAEILLFPKDQSGEAKKAPTTLSHPEINHLFVILGFSYPDEITDVPAESDDGLAATMSIYRQNPFTLRSANCNFAGWLDSRKSGPPAVEIGRILLGARTRAIAP